MQVSDFGVIILHTHPGYASSLAYFFDQKYVDYTSKNTKNVGLLGTIAGDDTVALIVKSKADIQAIIALIQKDFPYIAAS
jgi:transcriptional regulator of arginine metabolism